MDEQGKLIRRIYTALFEAAEQFTHLSYDGSGDDCEVCVAADGMEIFIKSSDVTEEESD